MLRCNLSLLLAHLRFERRAIGHFILSELSKLPLDITVSIGKEHRPVTRQRRRRQRRRCRYRRIGRCLPRATHCPRLRLSWRRISQQTQKQRSEEHTSEL